MPKPKIIIFDVNETLLDLVGLREPVGQALGDRQDLLPLWFSTMLHYSLVETVSGNHRSFGDIGTAALVMVAEANGIELGLSEARDAIVEPLESLPPHKDVTPALDRLARRGYRLVCLTNSSNGLAEVQLRRSGLIDYFEKRYSVEDVKRYKPHPAPYHMVLEDAGVQPEAALMVAAHAWDVTGAKRVGLQTAFVNRPGTALYPIAEAPDLVINDLSQLVDALTLESSIFAEEPRR